MGINLSESEKTVLKQMAPFIYRTCSVNESGHDVLDYERKCYKIWREKIYSGLDAIKEIWDNQHDLYSSSKTN